MSCYNRFIGRDSMPTLSKCWYKDCDSHPREDPKLLFYKFPKDLDRCDSWIANCGNPELSEIRKNNPERFSNLRVCQKHFLREFLGSSWRLVGHAVPLPYGMSLYGADAEKFMKKCADLKITSNVQRWHQRSLQRHQGQTPTQPRIQTRNHAPQNKDLNCQNNTHQITLNEIDIDEHHHQPLHSRSSNSLDCPVMNSNHEINIDLVSQQHYDQMVNRPISHDAISSSIDLPPDSSYNLTNSSSYHLEISQQANENQNMQQEEVITILLPEPPQQTVTSRLEQNANPKINYDRGGNVISIKYPEGTVSLSKGELSEKEQNDAHIIALKQKVRHYQRRLAALNHRYQKLKSQKIGGRSIKGKLLENLKLCKDEFNPCVYELFRTQIKTPSSRNGNRWSDAVKSFSASIYTRSRSAYKFVRRTIDLPSESIVKRYIELKKPDKLSLKTGTISGQNENEGGDVDNNEDDDDDDGGEGECNNMETEGNSSPDEGLLVQPTN